MGLSPRGDKKMATKKPWAWLDTETTGLKPSEGARVLQVAVHVTDDACRDVTRGGRVKFSSFIKLPPEVLAKAAPKALEVNHFAEQRTKFSVLQTPDDENRPYFACGPLATQQMTNEALTSFGGADVVWAMLDREAYLNAPPPHVVWQTVHTMLSGCHLVCQNLPFDKPFVENELALCGLTYPCDFRGIEIMSLSNLMSQHLGLTAWGLDKIYAAAAERYGFKDGDAHRADGDVVRMMEIYKFARQRFLGSWETEVKLARTNDELSEANRKIEQLQQELDNARASLAAVNYG